MAKALIVSFPDQLGADHAITAGQYSISNSGKAAWIKDSSKSDDEPRDFFCATNDLPHSNGVTFRSLSGQKSDTLVVTYPLKTDMKFLRKIAVSYSDVYDHSAHKL
jgi:hypothetical protein